MNLYDLRQAQASFDIAQMNIDEFVGEPIAITPIRFGNAKIGSLQGLRYATLEKMLKVNTVKIVV